MLKPIAQRNIRRPSRVEGYTLDAAGVAGSGKTSKDAVADWEKHAAAQDRYTFTRRYDFCTDGAVFALYYRDGWHYDIVRPNDARPCPARPPSGCCLGRVPYATALERYLAHLAQYNEIPAYSGVRQDGTLTHNPLTGNPIEAAS